MSFATKNRHLGAYLQQSERQPKEEPSERQPVRHLNRGGWVDTPVEGSRLEQHRKHGNHSGGGSQEDGNGQPVAGENVDGSSSQGPPLADRIGPVGTSQRTHTRRQTR